MSKKHHWKNNVGMWGCGDVGMWGCEDVEMWRKKNTTKCNFCIKWGYL